MEKLAKQFTRDVSLAICQWWRTSQNENFKRKIGAGYSDFLAVSNGLSCTFYCLESDVLPRHKRPKIIEFVEALPRNVLGKIDRTALR